MIPPVLIDSPANPRIRAALALRERRDRDDFPLCDRLHDHDKRLVRVHGYGHRASPELLRGDCPLGRHSS